MKTAPAAAARNEWLRAFAVPRQGMAIECYTEDGSVTNDKRSFQLSYAKGDKTYSLRLKHKEVLWLQHMLDLDFGTHTLVLFPGRELSLSLSDTLIGIVVRQEPHEFKIYLQPNQVPTLTNILADVVEILEVDWPSLRKDQVYEALGLAQAQHADLPLDAKTLLARAIGDRANDPRIDSLIDYGKRLGEMGNPERVKVDLAGELTNLLRFLSNDEVVDLRD